MTVSPAPPGAFATPDLAPIIERIFRRHGPGLLNDRSRLLGLLRDHAPAAGRDVRVLLTAFDTGAAARLGVASSPAGDAVLAEEAARMVDLYGCSPDLAHAAVATWDRAAARLRIPAPLPGLRAANPTGRPAVLPLPSVTPLPASPVPPLPLLPLDDGTPRSAFARWAPIVAGVLALIAATLRITGHL